jgi:hypothetical protein
MAKNIDPVVTVTVTKKASEFLECTSDDGGYLGGRCTICKASGWINSDYGNPAGFKHKPGCSVGEALRIAHLP